MQIAICSFRRLVRPGKRRGGVYIAVLGAALVISLLGLSALVGQRIQNRLVTASADIRQAQLNANTAVELALLSMKQENNWRTARPHGNWFVNRPATAGTCTANVTDPIDSDLANNSTDPVTVLGIGYSGDAEQRLKATFDTFTTPISSLRSAIAVGDTIDLHNDTLRTQGLISASTVSASSSQVYGNVEAITVSGSTYNSTTTQINAAKRPTMPNWSSVFDYYRTNGTEIPYGSLPATPSSNFVRNWTFENGTSDWTGSPPGGLPTAELTTTNNWVLSSDDSLRVRNRTSWNAGACQRIDHFVKPGQVYNVSAWVYVPGLGLGNSRSFRMTMFTKGTGDNDYNFDASPSDSARNILGLNWPAHIEGQITAPAWSGDLEYAFIKVSDSSSDGNTNEFYLDDVVITEASTGRYIYRAVISPEVNTSYSGAPTNQSEGKTRGIYWINCNGNRLTIERSRILGTLLIVNPGADSSVAHGPISWKPAVAGYPALLVDADTATSADFTISATNRALNEKESLVNYNPPGAAHSEFGQDTNVLDDIYQSEIRGLIAIEDDLTYHNRPYIRGQVLVGDDISSSSGSLEVNYQAESLLSPPPGFLAPNTFERRPASVYKAVLP
jgi:hypothetical protein